jgi:hypothetical protein
MAYTEPLGWRASLLLEQEDEAGQQKRDQHGEHGVFSIVLVVAARTNHVNLSRETLTQKAKKLNNFRALTRLIG